ncbi:hypothetical protein C8J57DRAFT_1492379 [Mycena rebaudengoi]|nr:hypothetical protein C8J57DRAFT_1492379 [Mycena rebaudengoi]
MSGHGRRFLGISVLDTDFFWPLPYSVNKDAFTTTRNARAPDERFRAVLFGEICSAPLTAGHHNYVLLRLPSWTDPDAVHDDVSIFYTAQLDTLNSIDEELQRRDFDTEQERVKQRRRGVATEIQRFFPTRSWQDGAKIKINICGGGSFPTYTLPSLSGEYGTLQCQQDIRSFPFANGDLVVVDATMHFYEWDFSRTDFGRDLTLLAHSIQLVKKVDTSD